MSDELRPDEWANVVIAKIAEAIHGLPVTEHNKTTIRCMVAETLPKIWSQYAAEYTGPRAACGCPERPDEAYQEHPGEPCDWSHWHSNQFSDALREDRFCWKCGAMETQVLGL